MNPHGPYYPVWQISSKLPLIVWPRDTFEPYDVCPHHQPSHMKSLPLLWVQVHPFFSYSSGHSQVSLSGCCSSTASRSALELDLWPLSCFSLLDKPHCPSDFIWPFQRWFLHFHFHANVSVIPSSPTCQCYVLSISWVLCFASSPTSSLASSLFFHPLWPEWFL